MKNLLRTVRKIIRSGKVSKQSADPPAIRLFVSPNGNDHWSGKLPAPDHDRKDGPFASIVRARDEIRKLKTEGHLTQPFTVRIRGGRYEVTETIQFTAQDSGTRPCPITYEAYPGEVPILSGGREIIGWRHYRGKIQCAYLPEVKAGKWHFRSLFADGERQVRARYPNIDAGDPYRRGFLYVSKGDADNDRLCINNAFNAGDWLEYELRVPVDGDYAVWLQYSGEGRQFGITDMGGRVSICVDSGRPVSLERLPGIAHRTFKWACCARLALQRGRHTLIWRNDRGGMINLKTFALCNDPAWIPAAGNPLKPPNGKRLILIRATDFRAAHAREMQIYPALGGEEYDKTSFPYRPGDVKPSWAKDREAQINIYPGVNYWRTLNEIARLEEVNEAAHTVKISGLECIDKIQTGDRFFVENVFEELDSPGEWYLDRQKGILYHWPKKIHPKVITPVISQMFQFLGTLLETVQYITLRGLTIQDTDYEPFVAPVQTSLGVIGREGTIQLYETAHCNIVNCRLRNIGQWAVFLKEGGDNVISGNDIEFCAQGGIKLEDSAGNLITDNHIHHAGQAYKVNSGVDISGTGSSRNVISHNSIHDISRAGLSMGNAGKYNRIEFNEIWNVNLESYDSGAIYVGSWSYRSHRFRSNTVIRYNLVHDTVGYSSDMGRGLFQSNGIYLDGYQGGCTVSHNIVLRNSSCGVFLQGGQNNHVFNNIIADNAYVQVGLANYQNNVRGLTFERNIIYYSGPANLYSMGGIWGNISQQAIRSDKNLFYHADSPEINLMWYGRWKRGDWSEPKLGEWRKAGFDRNSIIADPLFVNAGKDDFRLRPGSPAFHLGFEPIDVRKIGLLRDRCHCKRWLALRELGPCSFRCASCRRRRLGPIPCRHMAPGNVD